jgi:flagellar basal-body rod modification protein FlgD
MATDISSLPATASGASKTGAISNAGVTMGKEDFLKLLTTQLRYQDPLSPSDPKDFVAQLAQFSSVEQLINLNSKYESNNQALQNLQNSMGIAQGVSLLGKTVKAQGSNFQVVSGQPGNMNFILGGSASQVTVNIYNGANQLVRTMKLGAMNSGENKITWDGKDNSGKQAPDGGYSYQVNAVDSKGKSVSAATLVSGTVDEVLQDQNKVYLKVNGRLITLDSILSVDQ